MVKFVWFADKKNMGRVISKCFLYKTADKLLKKVCMCNTIPFLCEDTELTFFVMLLQTAWISFKRYRLYTVTSRDFRKCP